jgi:hypothetical protein
MRRTLLVLLALLAVPALAAAHSVVSGGSGEITYVTEDATSANCLQVTETATEIVFHEPKRPDGSRCVDNGMNVSGDCAPGQDSDNGLPYEVRCPKSGKELVRVDVGEREDSTTTSIGISVQLLAGNGADTITINGNAANVLLGGTGNDTLTTGDGDDLVKDEDGDDQVKTGGGRDTIQGGLGLDAYDSGAGDDDVRTRDGEKDTIACGGGTDKVTADTLDDIASDCETIDRQQVAPPAGGSRDDGRAPKLAVGADTVQRVRKRRRFHIAATMTERGTIAASGRLVAGGLFLPMRAKTKTVKTPGQGIELTVRLKKRAMKAIRRSWRKGRRPFVRMDVVATDVAGNSTTRKAPKIYLRR